MVSKYTHDSTHVCPRTRPVTDSEGCGVRRHGSSSHYEVPWYSDYEEMMAFMSGRSCLYFFFSGRSQMKLIIIFRCYRLLSGPHDLSLSLPLLVPVYSYQVTNTTQEGKSYADHPTRSGAPGWILIDLRRLNVVRIRQQDLHRRTHTGSFETDPSLKLRKCVGFAQSQE